MSDWSDDVPVSKPIKKIVVKKAAPDSDWSDEAPVAKPVKKSLPKTEAPKKQAKKVESDWSDEEPVKPKKVEKPVPKKASQPVKKDDDWSDDEPAPKKVEKPKPVVKKPASIIQAANKKDDWSDEEPRKVTKKPTPPKQRKPVEDDWSDDEPVQTKKVSKPKVEELKKAAPKPKKPVEDDWSDEDPVPTKKMSKVKIADPPVAKTSKQKVDDDWSDEEPAAPKKVSKPVEKSKPVFKKAVEDDWSDEEPTPKPKPKSAPKPKPAPKQDSDWSEDEKPVKQKPKPVEKNNDGWSDEEIPPTSTNKSSQSKPRSKTPPSRDLEKEDKPKKKANKNDDWSDDEKPQKTKNNDAWSDDDSKTKPKQKTGFDSDDDNADDKSLTDVKDNTEREPVTYIPEYFADEDPDLYTTGISAGINFDDYDKIADTCSGGVNGEGTDWKIQKWSDVEIAPKILNNIISKDRLNWSKPTPIQKRCLPILMNKKDVMCCAQTGSGKTGAYAIPILNSILKAKRDADELSDDEDGDKIKPYALIIGPTRELVQQIQREFVKLAKNTNIKCEYAVGQHAVRDQLDRCAGCDVLVATPGRLNDFVGKNKVSLDSCEYFIIDEADRMLEMGFQEILNELTIKMKDQGDRTTGMFSATFPEEIQPTAAKFLGKDYLFVAIGTVGSAATSVRQTFLEVTEDMDKEAVLMDMLQPVKDSGERTVIFVQTRRMADFFATKLSGSDFPATSIHGDRLQRERETALHQFRTGQYPILVATNVAARGLDIKDVKHVINLDLPKETDEYVHRIGRTGRCGNIGKSTSFFNPKYDKEKAPAFVEILSKVQQPVPEFLQNYANGIEPSVPAVGGDDDGSDDGW